MISMTVLGFLKYLGDHRTILSGLGRKPPLEGIVRVARAHGFTFSVEELRAALPVIKAGALKTEKAASESKELADAELEQVSGGTSFDPAPGSAELAAPFIPGAAVLTAAISGTRTPGSSTTIGA